jgi:PleD family two-component response regulator
MRLPEHNGNGQEAPHDVLTNENTAAHSMQVVSPDRPLPRLLIADDHEIFANALRAYLEKAYTVVGLASDGSAMVKE